MAQEVSVRYDVSVKEVPDQAVAAVRVRTSMDRIVEDMGRGFGAIMEAMRGAAPAGAPFVVYHDWIDAEMAGTMEICVPVAMPFEGTGEGAGEVYGATIEGGTMASTVHHGPYGEVGPAYEAITAWIAERGRQTAGPPREVYLNDPQAVPPEELLTEILWPIR